MTEYIGIIDLGICNIASVQRALQVIGVDSGFCRKGQDLSQYTRFILPGVGNFSEAASRIRSKGLRSEIRQQVLNDKKPILGICLGMQLLAHEGLEGGGSEGLGLINATVEPMETDLRIPHIGWNSIKTERGFLLKNIPDETCFYFVHSYEMRLYEDVVSSHCSYGKDVLAYVEKEGIFGTQFHPEKSQTYGIQILKNFVAYRADHVAS